MAVQQAGHEDVLPGQDFAHTVEDEAFMLDLETRLGDADLVVNLDGTAASSLRNSSSTRRPVGLRAVLSCCSVRCGCDSSW